MAILAALARRRRLVALGALLLACWGYATLARALGGLAGAVAAGRE